MGLIVEIILIIVPVSIGFGIYIAHQRQSPTTSFAKVKSRIRRYYLGMFSLWFLVVAFLLTLGYIEGLNQDRQNCLFSSDQFCLQRLEENMVLDYVLQLAYVAVLALIPTLILYALLHVYHRLYASYEKPKIKNDEREL